MIPSTSFLLIGALLFTMGVFLVLTRRNLIMALMGIELMLNAANINFAVFSRMDQLNLDGQVASLFVMALAAAEIGVALAIVLQAYRRYGTVRIDEISRLKDRP
ncbi:MAG: NADH-quinone oxidoreductase subunit NuoK [Bacteroidota bacterium]